MFQTPDARQTAAVIPESGQRPFERVIQMATGFIPAQSISVAAKLGIADLVKDRPRTAGELAAATGTHAGALYRLLRGLASLGIFAEDAAGRFILTPMADTLRSDAPDSVRDFAIMMGEEQFRAWGDLLHTVQTGENAFAYQHGMPVFAWFQQHPEQFQTFDRAMTNVHGPEDAAIAAAYDFSKARTVADIGGGRGTLLAAILAANPHLNGILFDMPQVIEHARKSIGGDRVEFMSGDFFESVPYGADVYFMRHIIHDWNDEQAIAILRRCREAMHASARLIVAEPVIPPGNDPHMGKMMDLHMMVVTGGKERTESEYRELFAHAGFRLSKVIPTPAPIIDLIEGVPA